MGVRIGGQVEKVNGKELSYEDFVDKYLAQNQPVVLTGLMDDWRACKDWITASGEPNLQFFSDHFGNSKVQVADCGTREFTDQKRIEMSVSEFIDHWVDLNSGGGDDGSKPLLYLKDWHFAKEYPEYNAYNTPLLFCDDWLNMYLDNYRMHNDPDMYNETNEISCSDYRFAYMGAKGTWTPLHADVFRSYSWSANVCGRKKWYFLSPNQSHFVFDRNMKNSVYNIFEEVNEKKFPDFEKAIWWECTQEQNEIIFVPSGWYHQVQNLEDTISINHNWFNAYNLAWVWDLLLRDYKEAREYIEDIKDICDDFEGLCQRNLAANTGMNFNDFFIFMVRIAFANVVQLYSLSRNRKNPGWCSPQRARHLLFNFESLRSIVLKIKSVFWGKNCGTVNLGITLEEQAFRELYTHIGRTYNMIHKQCEGDYDINQALLEDVDVSFFRTSSCCVGSPEDLVSIVDFAMSKLCEMLAAGEVAS